MAQNDKLAKSRLGRLLINRGYITEDQLAEALKIQVASEGSLLGEVLVSQGFISENDLKRTLNHQKRYRYTAAFVALVAAPFQPMLAMAASPVSLPLNSAKIELSSIEMGSFGGLKMMDDSELSDVSAQGFGGTAPGLGLGINFGQNSGGITAGFSNKYQDNEEFEEQEDEQIANQLADTVLTVAGFGPISGMIDAKITVEGLKYQEGRSQIEILEGGRMKFYMPTEIAKISMEDIRVKGNTSGPTMGSIYMSDIKFNPESNYVVGAKRELTF